MINIVGEIVRGVLSPLTDWWTTRQKVQQAKVESQLRINEAKTTSMVSRLETGQAADIKWEHTALEQSGIKDEVVMFVILTPMVLCFCGEWGRTIVSEGFIALRDTVPVWWQSAFGATVGVSYGLKKWTDFKSFAKGE